MSAIVTGGASGIGAAVTARLRSAGDTVTVWDREGGDIACDIADPDAVAQAMTQTVDSAGVPTGMVACAGVGASGLLLDQTPEQWRQVLEVNLTGTWLSIREAARTMIAAGVPGSIVALLDLSWVTGQVLFADGGLAQHSSIDAYGQVQRLTRKHSQTL